MSDRSKFTMNRARLVILLFAVLTGGFILWYRWSATPPTDAFLIDEFRSQKAVYERLRDMLQGDESLRRVASWGVQLSNSPIVIVPQNGGFPLGRYKEYMTLLSKVNGLAASRSGGSHPTFCVFLWASGWAGDTDHRAICWLPQDAENNAIESSAKNQVPRFSFLHIEERWFLQKG